MPERACDSCKNQAMWGCDAYDTGKLDAYDQPVWGNAAYIPLEIDGEQVWRCPRRPIKDDPGYWDKLLFFHGLFKKGHLIDEGNVLGQSHKALKLFEIVDAALHECLAESRRREEDKRSRPTHGGS